MLQDIGERAGVEISNLATKTGATSAGQTFLRASNAAGSSLHQGVYSVGKFLGFNFKPWQAVNFAKNIGNVAKVLGSFLSVGTLAMDLYAKQHEEEQDKKLADARREITSQFIALAKNLDSQVEIQLREVEAQVYGKTEKQIAEARQNEEEAISSSNQWVGELAALRKEFDKIICDINNSSDVSKQTA